MWRKKRPVENEMYRTGLTPCVGKVRKGGGTKGPRKKKAVLREAGSTRGSFRGACFFLDPRRERKAARGKGGSTGKEELMHPRKQKK